MDLDSAERVKRDACTGKHTAGLCAPEMRAAVGKVGAHDVSVDLYALGASMQGRLDSGFTTHRLPPAMAALPSKLMARHPSSRGTADEAIAVLEKRSR